MIGIILGLLMFVSWILGSEIHKLNDRVSKLEEKEKDKL